MMPHLFFIISYLYYIYFYLLNCEKIIYPLFLFVFVVYIFIFIFALLDYCIKKESVILLFQKYSKVLYLFVLLILTPAFIKLNFPQPHNFIQRKLEIMLGAAYSVFITGCVIVFMAAFIKNYRLFNTKKIFYLLVLFFFFFYFAVSLWFNYANQPTGDEPEYILMAHSIIYDRDIDLKNNFTNRDYKIFYKEKNLYPQGAAVKKDEKLYSYHPFFISLLISPFYFTGKRFGVTIFMNFIAATLAGMLFLIIYKIFMDTEVSFITALISGFSMPIFNHINHIATDMTSGFILTCAFYVLLFLPHRYILFSFLVIASLWLHIRNIPIAFILTLLYVINNKRKVKMVANTIILQVVNIILYLIINKIIYGNYIINQGANKTDGYFFGGFHIDAIKVITSFFGLFFDQEFGLFFYTPLFILIFAGYYFLYKQKKEIFYNLIIILLPFLFFISMWGEWRGGGGSSPRFFLPLIFTIIIPVAAAIYNCRDILTKKIFYFLAFLNFIMSFFVFLIPWFRWNKGDGANWILKILSSFINFNLTEFFPSFWVIKKHTILSLIFWVIVILILNISVIIKNTKYIDK